MATKTTGSILVTADIGSFNIKIVGGGIYENRYLLKNNDETIGANYLVYNGNTYYFGVGEFSGEELKTNKEMLIPLLYALGRDKISGNINLILHLPPREMARKQMLIDEFKDKEFNYTVNGTDYTIKIGKVGVLKEGFSSFYSLAKRNEGKLAVIDIGGRTTEVFTFIDGVPDREQSYPIGTIKYFDEIATALIGKGENFTKEKIHRALQDSDIDINDFKDITQGVYDRLINLTKDTFPDLKYFNIKLTGGGSEYFKDLFKKNYKKVSILTNALTSNVDGAEKIGKAKGFDK